MVRDNNIAFDRRLQIEARQQLQLDFLSKPLAIRSALSDIRDWQSRLNMCDEHQDVTEMVLAEILNNISIHAYGTETPGRIQVLTRFQKRDFHVRVCDAGLPLPKGEIPVAALPACDVALEYLPEGGFGWFLIKKRTRDLTYTRSGDQNILDFSIVSGKGDARQMP